jgi:tyrosyl-tRNA synthetase
VRRRLQRGVHALTWPLLTKPDGSKYGKTAGGETIWLSPHKMSPYRFYQSWIGVDDAEVRKLLLQLTFLSVEEVDALVVDHEADPGRRLGQRTLARELTSIVHGADAADAAVEASELLFGRDLDPRDASAAALEFVAGEVPSSSVAVGGRTVVDVLVDTELAQSRGDAKRAVGEGGVYLNGERINDLDHEVSGSDLLHGRFLLLRRGKKRWHVGTAD